MESDGGKDEAFSANDGDLLGRVGTDSNFVSIRMIRIRINSRDVFSRAVGPFAEDHEIGVRGGTIDDSWSPGNQVRRRLDAVRIHQDHHPLQHGEDLLPLGGIQGGQTLEEPVFGRRGVGRPGAADPPR